MVGRFSAPSDADSPPVTPENPCVSTGDGHGAGNLPTPPAVQRRATVAATSPPRRCPDPRDRDRPRARFLAPGPLRFVIPGNVRRESARKQPVDRARGASNERMTARRCWPRSLWHPASTRTIGEALVMLRHGVNMPIHRDDSRRNSSFVAAVPAARTVQRQYPAGAALSCRHARIRHRNSRFFYRLSVHRARFDIRSH